MALQLVTDDIIPTGKITGISRREDIFDTEAWNLNTVIVDIKTFRSFNAFANATPTLNNKQEFIDTNLGGSTAGGLPNAMVFIWYKWRSKISTRNANMQLASTQPCWEEIRRIRKSTSKIVNFSISKYMTAQGDETVGLTDSENFGGGIPGSVVPTPFLGAHFGKDITINGLPREISSLQDFNVETLPMAVPALAVSTLTPALVSPTVNYYVSEILGGVLTRGVAA